MQPIEFDPTDSAALEAARKDVAVAQENAIKTERDDIRWMMNNKRGRRILWRILARARVLQTPFDTNALRMAANVGSREEGVHLMGLIFEVAPELYLTMAEEAKPPKA